MWLLSLFATAVFAAEMILSPLPDDGVAFPTPQPTPEITFGQLLDYALPEVLGESVEVDPSPTPMARLHRKTNYTIALLGDSMIDTLGPDAPHLKDRLKKLYPSVSFTILNYGVGGENIESGISRLTSEYTYLGEVKPSLISQNPDIVVVESFGYNPYIDPINEVDRHWLALAQLIDTLKSSLPHTKIIIGATIAPNANIFGDGALNWSDQQKTEKVVRIKSLLENAIKFARSQNIPLANAYAPSLKSDGNGKIEYINPGDHIHYSDAGRDLFAREISRTIVSQKLLQ